MLLEQFFNGVEPSLNRLARKRALRANRGQPCPHRGDGAIEGAQERTFSASIAQVRQFETAACHLVERPEILGSETALIAADEPGSP